VNEQGRTKREQYYFDQVVGATNAKKKADEATYSWNPLPWSEGKWGPKQKAVYWPTEGAAVGAGLPSLWKGSKAGLGAAARATGWMSPIASAMNPNAPVKPPATIRSPSNLMSRAGSVLKEAGEAGDIPVDAVQYSLGPSKSAAAAGKASTNGGDIYKTINLGRSVAEAIPEAPGMMDRILSVPKYALGKVANGAGSLFRALGGGGTRMLSLGASPLALPEMALDAQYPEERANTQAMPGNPMLLKKRLPGANPNASLGSPFNPWTL